MLKRFNYIFWRIFFHGTTVLQFFNLCFYFILKMVKKIPSELNLLRQRRRSAIQLYVKEHPEAKLNEVAKLFHVSSMTVAKWKKKDYFIDTKRNRKTKMIKILRNFY